jgi:tyrosyl-DNA phosphodiesterase 2
VDIIPPTALGTVFRLIKVHLNSLRVELPYHAQKLTDIVHELGCSGGIVAGNLNAI